MTSVKDLITQLLDECDGDTNMLVDFYVKATPETLKARAENEEWIDDFLNIDEFDNNGGVIHINLEEIEY